MSSLRKLIPEATHVVEMPTAELAGYVLEALLSEGTSGSNWHCTNFCKNVDREYAEPGRPSSQDVGISCSSALGWLQANGFICQHPEHDLGWLIATAKGRNLRDHKQLHALVSGELLPESFLHPDLLENARPLFLQGRFETAVFEAFKTLEVAIRTAARLGQEMIGVSLASRAFNPEDGALTDLTAEKGERVALMNLMTGALGSYKNPSSHRRVEIGAAEAREMIVLASHLLKIVEGRASMNDVA